jgi:hypothetical protein
VNGSRTGASENHVKIKFVLISGWGWWSIVNRGCNEVEIISTHSLSPAPNALEVAHPLLVGPIVLEVPAIPFPYYQTLQMEAPEGPEAPVALFGVQGMGIQVLHAITVS